MTKVSKVHPYIEWAKSRLDEMDATLSAFQGKVEDLGGDARVKAKEALSDMQVQRDAFKSFFDKNLQSAESVWEAQSAKLKKEWKAFEDEVETYVKSTKNNAEQYEAAFKARADAQVKAWQEMMNNAFTVAAKFPEERKADFDDAVAKMKSEAEVAESRLAAMKKAGQESWSALDAALSESRKAFDKATEDMQKAFKRAMK
ncbi:MAG: hypothetical protein K9G33_03265 [Sneathiella sp.]|nr:hypothetical protein [Sneathiella sp.]